VNNQQHDCEIPNRCRANRAPAWFSGFVYAVQIYQAELVFEDQRRQLK
jgi:hypothetical protein